MKSRRTAAVVGLLLLAAAGAAAALYLANRPDVTTSSRDAYRAYQDAVRNERRFYFKEARLGFARALALDPQFAMAMLGLARISERDQAVSLVKRASREKERLNERERLHVDMQMAGISQRQDDFLRIAQRIHQKYPDDIRAAMILAGREIENGNTARALQIFSELLAVEPNNADAYNQIGYYYGYRGDYEKAIENIQKYRFMAPDQANPYDSLGEIQAYSGRYDEAIANLNRALAIKPDFFEAYGHLGVAYEGKGEYVRAVENYEKAADQALTDDRRLGFLGKAMNAACLAGEAGLAERISVRLERLPANPYTAVVKPFLEASLELVNGRPAEAEKLLAEVRPKWLAIAQKETRGTRYKPYEPYWNYLMAAARVAQGKLDEALPLYEEMASPPNPWRNFDSRRLVYEGRAHLAALLARKGNLDRAEKLLEENRKWNPSWAPTRAAELAVGEKRREKMLSAAR